MSHTDARRMYSWWWDSHISPKSSKWLQENLTDMDGKVKAMIKLIEEDADSFARRAEMYYKKRPELMKLVEEFYRAYRALAERYDHATGVIRHAHRTMAEAFPNQVSLMLSDDSHASSVSWADLRTPDMSTPLCITSEADYDLQNEDLGSSLSKSDFTGEFEYGTEKKVLKLNDPFGKSINRVRKGLNFEEVVQSNENNFVEDRELSEPDQASESEDTRNWEDFRIPKGRALEQTISKRTQEKEAAAQQFLDTISNLEDKLLSAQEEAKRLNSEIENGEAKLQSAREQCILLERSNRTLHSELDALMLKMGTREQELTEKQKELGRIRACVREERSSFLKTKTTFQEELRSVAAKLENKAQTLAVAETRVRCLEDEVRKFEEENKQILEKNCVLEFSLSDLSVELEAIRGKVEALEQFCEFLMNEKSTLVDENATLISQLKETNVNLEKLSENNNVLVKSLSGRRYQLEASKAKSKILEDSCQLLVNEKAELTNEKDGLQYELENTRVKLEGLEKIRSELEHRCITLEKEKESNCRRVQELQISLDVERQEFNSHIQTSQTQVISVETEKRLLNEECRWRKIELDEVLDMAIEKEVEILFLQITVHELEERSRALLIKNQKLLEESIFLERKISELEEFMCHQEVEIKFLTDQANGLRAGIIRLLNVVESSEDHPHKHEMEQDQIFANILLNKIQNMKESLCRFTNEIENGKSLLHHMELELQEAEKNTSVVEKEKLELEKDINDLRKESIEVKKIQDFQKHQIVELEVELHELRQENNKKKGLEENLHSELQNKIKEINKLETWAASVYGQLQCSMISQLVYEQKFHELQEANRYVDQNERLFDSEIASLKECMSSLENLTDVQIKFQNPDNEELKGCQYMNVNKEKTIQTPETCSDLRDVRARLQAFEKALFEIKELMVQENNDLRFKLDASTNQVEFLKSKGGKYKRNSKPTSEILGADNVLVTKDIVLDQTSDASSHSVRKREEPVGVDDQIVELWETSEPDGTIGLTVGKSKKAVSASTLDETNVHNVAPTRKHKSETSVPNSDSVVEKELSVDKLEIPQQGRNKRKYLARLDSNVQKLANLQITVQDLKRKLEVTEKGKRGKAVIECESLKGRLEESDATIMKLFDHNARLTKSVEKSTFSEVEDSSRRRLREQVQTMSEKTARLQLEIQKLQFVLHKIDEEKEEKSKASETKRRVLLRDYLYGGRGASHRQKKAQFCACSQPQTLQD